MFCFHVKTRDFEREGRFFDGGRKLFGTTLSYFFSGFYPALACRR